MNLNQIPYLILLILLSVQADIKLASINQLRVTNSYNTTSKHIQAHKQATG